MIATADTFCTGDGDGDFWQESVLEAAFHWGRFNGCNDARQVMSGSDEAVSLVRPRL